LHFATTYAEIRAHKVKVLYPYKMKYWAMEILAASGLRLRRAYKARLWCLVLSITYYVSFLPTLNADAQILTDWMQGLNGEKRLSQLSIPGTHDSGARLDPWYGPGTTKCQRLSIGEQLEIGVRFLDIRCFQSKNEFRIYHGLVDQNLTFSEVIDRCSQFLICHPSECILMSVQEDCGPTFEDTFDSYVAANKSLWWLQANIPKLDEVRGKIVLIRRFEAHSLPKGIDATKWRDNDSFSIYATDANLRVQDNYKIWRLRKKWASITNLYEESRTDDSNCLYINFASGYRPVLFYIPFIAGGYKKINPMIKAYFMPSPSNDPSSIHSVTVLDFANRELCSSIVMANFLKERTSHFTLTEKHDRQASSASDFAVLPHTHRSCFSLFFLLRVCVCPQQQRQKHEPNQDGLK
jgi:1-phosphatidylinositol phosphodiesterase